VERTFGFSDSNGEKKRRKRVVLVATFLPGVYGGEYWVLDVGVFAWRKNKERKVVDCIETEGSYLNFGVGKAL